MEAGASLGVAAALVSARLVEELLFGVHARDPGTKLRVSERRPR
jgi:hypothetical protein